MTAPRRSLPALVKVIVSATLLLFSGGVLSVAACFGTLSTVNRAHGTGVWEALLFAGLGFVALGVLLFVGIGIWAAIILLRAGLRRFRGEAA